MSNFTNKSKHSKYTTTNPISIYLINRFFDKVKSILNTLRFENILDAGCGEGLLLSHLKNDLSGRKIQAIDLDPLEIETAKKNIPFAECQTASIYELPFKNSEFDLVLCMEVLEHLDNPVNALKELSRVSKKYCLLSVPNEPVWRILNILRGSYITKLGNTPGHINHWSSKAIEKLVNNSFNIIKIEKSLPWTILLCEKK
ncbi:class I SAM-dependent methyltransferase [bacterium]